MPDGTDYSPREAPLGEQGEAGSLVAFPRTHSSKCLPDNNLPLELTSFIGREKEVAKIERLLGGGARLVTLCGPGGCGKTRLALAVARDLLEGFEDGAWWVELAPLSDPKLVPGAVALALGVREVPDRSLTEVLVEHLKGRKTLLVLDNCEHLVEGCAVLANALLRACPELEILATSREPLRIAGESTWLVPSLSLPDPQRLPPTGELARYEAVRLFVERAGAVDAGFALTERNASAVAQLCHELDGIPLAIELAAARARVLTVEQISEKLKDPLELLTTGSRAAPPRHQTLRATLEWSYELLSEQERELLERLSVFARGWALEAAEAVGAGEPVEAGRVLDLLSVLVDKSLVVAEASPVDARALRYRMLEPVRQYALERLSESGEEEGVRRAHAKYFLALAEEAEPRLTTGEQLQWLNGLENEHSNLRAALSWSLERGQVEVGLRLCGALWRFWYLRGHLSEGRRWLERALVLDEGAEHLRAGVLSGAGHLAFAQGDHDRAQTLCKESLALSRRSGYERGAAESLNGVAFTVRRKGDYARGRALHEEALELYRGLGDEWGIARSVLHVGTAAAFQGDHAAALRWLAEALRMFREIGDRECIAEAVGVAGMVDLARGEWAAARSRFEEAQAVMSALEDRRGVAKMIAPQGDAALGQRDQATASALYQEALTILKDLDDKWWSAWCLEGMAGVAAAQMQPERAVRLFGAVARLRDAIRAPRPPAFLALRERNLATARDRLGEEVFEEAWAEGQAMSAEQAIEYALSAEEEEEPASSAPATKTTSKPPVSSSYPAGLSAREAEVLKLVAEGLTNAKIAERLFISPRTVERHLNSVYAKLKVGSRAAATRFAIEHGLA